MKISGGTLGLIFILIFAGILAVIWLGREQMVKQAAEPPPDFLKVAATIPPLNSIVKSIGGGRIQVELVIPPNASPHTYEPRPNDIARLKDAQVVFGIGQGLDDWVEGMIGEIKWYEVSKGINLISDNESQRDREKPSNYNPHYWLSTTNGKKIAENVKNYLIGIDPEGQEIYQANYEKFVLQMDEGELRITETLSDMPTRQMVTFHNAWPYFAQEFDLEIVAIFESFPGKEPTLQYLENLEDTIKACNVKVIFSEPQLSTQSLEPFLADLSLEIAELDPLGGYEIGSYLEMLENNAQIIGEVLHVQE